jgi:uncharacterized protein (DUF1015 family)
LHITRSEIDLADAVAPYAEEVYQTAKSNLKAFISRSVLFKEAKPCYYLYRLTMQGRSQSGLVCVSSVEDYEQGIIKKHEHTRPEKEQDRIRHIVGTGAQTGNVFVAYRNVKEIDEFVESWQQKRSPIYDFLTDDEIRHEVWVINNDKAIDAITALFAEKVPCTYIADGHHRAASATKARDQFTSERALEKSDWFLTTLFPASQLQILDYNRLVTDLNGMTHEQFFNKLSNLFNVEAKGRQPFKPEQPMQFGLYIDKVWYKLVTRPGIVPKDKLGSLDANLLQQHVLHGILGIEDPRTDKRIDFVGGIRGLQALQERVDSGEMKLAFALYPVSLQQLFDIADMGEVMPPKSTWFEPKLRDGLLTHLIQ